MTQVIDTIDVDVPVRAAYDEWTQFESFPRFLDHVESVTQTDKTHNRWSIKIGGQERQFNTEITEQHPDERIAWKATDGDVDHAGVVTFHKLSDASTRVTVQIDWEPTGLLEHVGAVSGVVEHAVKKDLANFKELIEETGEAEGSWRKNVNN
jgi:uncharacterized membrane protein